MKVIVQTRFNPGWNPGDGVEIPEGKWLDQLIANKDVEPVERVVTGEPQPYVESAEPKGVIDETPATVKPKPIIKAKKTGGKK